MISLYHQPAGPLSQHIESIFYYKGFDPEHTIDRFLPDGNVQLVLDLLEEPKYIYDNDTLKEIQTCRKAWFSGFRTLPITIPSGRLSEMIVIQFWKGRAHPFISLPLDELKNQVVDAGEIMDARIIDIRERLQAARSPQEKLTILMQQLEALYLSKLQVNPCTDYVVNQINNSPQQCTLKNLVEKVGYSQKHLIKLFRQQVGVTPKEFLRVVRFQKSIENIGRNPDMEWTSLAYQCGFYDQSHFIADFKAFSGFTPEEYLRNRGDLLNYVPVDASPGIR